MCIAIKNDINSIKLCLSFSQGLKIQVVYFLNAPASGDSVPRPPAGASPLDPTGGLPSPRPPDLPPNSTFYIRPCHHL